MPSHYLQAKLLCEVHSSNRYPVDFVWHLCMPAVNCIMDTINEAIQVKAAAKAADEASVGHER
jgi:hypothetical protein